VICPAAQEAVLAAARRSSDAAVAVAFAAAEAAASAARAAADAAAAIAARRQFTAGQVVVLQDCVACRTLAEARALAKKYDQPALGLQSAVRRAITSAGRLVGRAAFLERSCRSRGRSPPCATPSPVRSAGSNSGW
jgi:hypothetical protein